MNKTIGLTILLFVTINFYGQNNILSKKPLDVYIQTTENSYNQLSELNILEIERISKILYNWEVICGENEPIARIKILLHIQNNKLDENLIAKYVTDYIYTFKDRVTASNSDNYKAIYAHYSHYYSYVPLKSNYDKWTKSIAQDLLQKQNEGTSEYLLCLLFSEQVDVFYKKIKSRDYKDNFIKNAIYQEKYDTWQRGMNYSIIAGAWFPIGKLSHTFDISPIFGFRGGFTFAKSLRFDIGFNLRVQNQQKPILIEGNNQINEVKSKTGLTGGIWATKEYRINNKVMIDAIVGLGVGILDTDLKKVNTQNTDNNKYYGVETADFSLGVNFRKRIFMKSSIGINISYHFSPYQLDKVLVNSIGYQHLTTALIYRF
jgi:uncharacterized protein YqkB